MNSTATYIFTYYARIVQRYGLVRAMPTERVTKKYQLVINETFMQELDIEPGDLMKVSLKGQVLRYRRIRKTPNSLQNVVRNPIGH